MTTYTYFEGCIHECLKKNFGSDSPVETLDLIESNGTLGEKSTSTYILKTEDGKRYKLIVEALECLVPNYWGMYDEEIIEIELI